MKQFMATLHMGVKVQSYFGLVDLVRTYLIRGVTLLAMLSIWRALFSQGARIEGLTLWQALVYTLMSTALYPILNIRTEAFSWIHDGTMISLYFRPSAIFAQIAAHAMGGWVMHLCIFSLPIIVLAGLAGMPLAPATPWFFVSLLLAVAQGFAVEMCFLCLLIQLRSLEWTVHAIREALSALLTGALIPFAALPWGLGEWLSLSPFGTLAGAPLALLTGLDRASRLIPAQIFWTVLLWPLAFHWFRRSSERMVSYGG